MKKAIVLIILAIGIAMTFRPLTTKNSQESNNSQINDMVRSLNRESQTKVFKGPNNVNALITGKLPNDLGYGFMFSDSTNTPRIIGHIDSSDEPFLKTSPSGVDVTTATDAQLNFNSAQNVFKIVDSGTTEIPAVTMATGANGNGQSSVVVAHNLGTIPAVIAYIVDRSGKYQLIPYSDADQLGVTFLSGGGAAIWFASHIYAQTDATNITFKHYATNANYGSSGDSRPATTVKYYILQETAN